MDMTNSGKRDARAVRKYSSALDRAQAIAKKFFVALKPSLTLDPSDGKITVAVAVAVGVEPSARLGAVAEAVEKAERQIRAAVHRHRAAWLDGEYTPERYSPKQLDELDRLTGRWLKDHARRTGRRRWPPYWRFLQVRTCALPTSRWTKSR